MAKLTYFPLIMDRWTAGTRTLTYEQKGFYLDLLIWLFETGKPIKNADHAARILGCDPRISRRLLADLSGKFRRTSAGDRHKLVDELRRNAGKVRGLQAINFPTDPDPDPDPDLRSPDLLFSEEIPLSGESKKGGSMRGDGRTPERPAPVVEPIVQGLNSKAWEEYQRHRQEIRARKLKPRSVTRLQRWLADQGDNGAQADIVDQTIRNGWTGLFELRASAKHHTTTQNSDEFDAWLNEGKTIEGEYEKH